jgi:hypothetical protein
MNSDTTNVPHAAIISEREQWLQEWEQRLQERENRLQTREENVLDEHLRMKNLEDEIGYLERFRASQNRELLYLRQTLDIIERRYKEKNSYTDNLRGLNLGDLDVDKLQQLNSTIQEASKLVQNALKLREAEEAVAEDKNLCCPIGIELMKDPVVAADGHTYERSKIEAWFQSPQFANLPVKSPMTNMQLDDTVLIRNHALKSVIQSAVDKKIASMLARERAVTPPPEVEESIGTVRTC